MCLRGLGIKHISGICLILLDRKLPNQAIHLPVVYLVAKETTDSSLNLLNQLLRKVPLPILLDSVHNCKNKILSTFTCTSLIKHFVMINIV